MKLRTRIIATTFINICMSRRLQYITDHQFQVHSMNFSTGSRIEGLSRISGISPISDEYESEDENSRMNLDNTYDKESNDTANSSISRVQALKVLLKAALRDKDISIIRFRDLEQKYDAKISESRTISDNYHRLIIALQNIQRKHLFNSLKSILRKKVNRFLKRAFNRWFVTVHRITIQSDRYQNVLKQASKSIRFSRRLSISIFFRRWALNSLNLSFLDSFARRKVFAFREHALKKRTFDCLRKNAILFSFEKRLALSASLRLVKSAFRKIQRLFQSSKTKALQRRLSVLMILFVRTRSELALLQYFKAWKLWRGPGRAEIRGLSCSALASIARERRMRALSLRLAFMSWSSFSSLATQSAVSHKIRRTRDAFFALKEFVTTVKRDRRTLLRIVPYLRRRLHSFLQQWIHATALFRQSSASLSLRNALENQRQTLRKHRQALFLLSIAQEVHRSREAVTRAFRLWQVKSSAGARVQDLTRQVAKISDSSARIASANREQHSDMRILFSRGEQLKKSSKAASLRLLLSLSSRALRRTAARLFWRWRLTSISMRLMEKSQSDRRIEQLRRIVERILTRRVQSILRGSFQDWRLLVVYEVRVSSLVARTSLRKTSRSLIVWERLWRARQFATQLVPFLTLYRVRLSLRWCWRQWQRRIRYLVSVGLGLAARLLRALRYQVRAAYQRWRRYADRISRSRQDALLLRWSLMALQSHCSSQVYGRRRRASGAVLLVRYLLRKRTRELQAVLKTALRRWRAAARQESRGLLLALLVRRVAAASAVTLLRRGMDRWRKVIRSQDRAHLILLKRCAEDYTKRLQLIADKQQLLEDDNAALREQKRQIEDHQIRQQQLAQYKVKRLKAMAAALLAVSLLQMKLVGVIWRAFHRWTVVAFEKGSLDLLPQSVKTWLGKVHQKGSSRWIESRSGVNKAVAVLAMGSFARRLYRQCLMIPWRRWLHWIKESHLRAERLENLQRKLFWHWKQAVLLGRHRLTLLDNALRRRCSNAQRLAWQRWRFVVSRSRCWELSGRLLGSILRRATRKQKISALRVAFNTWTAMQRNLKQRDLGARLLALISFRLAMAMVRLSFRRWQGLARSQIAFGLRIRAGIIIASSVIAASDRKLLVRNFHAWISSVRNMRNREQRLTLCSRHVDKEVRLGALRKSLRQWMRQVELRVLGRAAAVGIDGYLRHRKDFQTSLPSQVGDDLRSGLGRWSGILKSICPDLECAVYFANTDTTLVGSRGDGGGELLCVLHGEGFVGEAASKGTLSLLFGKGDGEAVGSREAADFISAALPIFKDDYRTFNSDASLNPSSRPSPLLGVIQLSRLHLTDMELLEARSRSNTSVKGGGRSNTGRQEFATLVRQFLESLSLEASRQAALYAFVDSFAECLWLSKWQLQQPDLQQDSRSGESRPHKAVRDGEREPASLALLCEGLQQENGLLQKLTAKLQRTQQRQARALELSQDRVRGLEDQLSARNQMYDQLALDLQQAQDRIRVFEEQREQVIGLNKKLKAVAALTFAK